MQTVQFAKTGGMDEDDLCSKHYTHQQVLKKLYEDMVLWFTFIRSGTLMCDRPTDDLTRH